MRTARALLGSVLRHHPGAAASAAIWLLVLAAATGAYGLLAGPIVRALFGGQATDWLRGWGIEPGDGPLWLPTAVVAVACVKGVATHFQAVTQARFGQRVVSHARARAHRALLHQNPLQLPGTGAGDLASRILDDTERLESLVTAGLLGGVRDGLQVVVLVGLCVALDPVMTVLFFGAYPVAIVPLVVLGRHIRRLAGTAATERGALANELHQQLHRFPLLAATGAQRWAAERVDRSSDALTRAVLRGVRMRATASPLMEVLGALALAFTVVFAQHRIAAGQLAPETVSSFLATTLLLYQPVKNLTRIPEVLAPGRVALERLAALGDEPRPDTEAVREPELAAGDIAVGLTLAELTVRYEEGGDPSLIVPHARFEPGRVTAVVGANGTGKSTLCAVLLGWLTPCAGGVTADGLPAGTSWARARTRAIGWIPTAPMLASGSIRENVALGRRPLTAAAWDRLARRAGLDVVLPRLAEGWETLLGDGGEGLSSGEQRRVALARALYDDPPILLFDEPEASLDDAGVAALVAALGELKSGRTIIVMTHDDRLVAMADSVVRLVRPARGLGG